MLDLFFITVTIVFCVDLSGLIPKLSKKVFKLLYKGVFYTGWRLPLIGCSLCSSWWCGILYLIITNQFSFALLAYVALLSFLTPVIKDLMIFIKDLFIKILNLYD